MCLVFGSRNVGTANSILTHGHGPTACRHFGNDQCDYVGGFGAWGGETRRACAPLSGLKMPRAPRCLVLDFERFRTRNAELFQGCFLVNSLLSLSSNFRRRCRQRDGQFSSGSRIPDEASRWKGPFLSNRHKHSLDRGFHLSCFNTSGPEQGRHGRSHGRHSKEIPICCMGFQKCAASVIIETQLDYTNSSDGRPVPFVLVTLARKYIVAHGPELFPMRKRACRKNPWKVSLRLC